MRAHFLAQSALSTLLLVDEKDDKEINFDNLQRFYDNALNSQFGPEELLKLESDPTFKSIQKELQGTKNRLKEESCTARLWIQYMDYVDVAKQFIYAERTSKWELH